MLVELGLVEQRYQAVLEVLDDGATVTDVARRHGVARQTVHDWLRRYAADGLGGLADRSSKPLSCPHQMAPVVEARIVELRRAHPGWGPRTILHRLGREGVEPLPGRSSVDRCLVRHGLVDPQARRRSGRTTSAGSGPGPWSCGRWTSSAASAWPTAPSVKIGHRHRRPLAASACAPGWWPGPRPGRCATPWRQAMRAPRGARPDPDRQRQGVHRPLRAGARAGAVRPDLPGQRHPPPAHRALLADHDGQGGALAQDPAGRVPRPARCSHSDHRRGPGRLDAWVDALQPPSGRTSRIGMVAAHRAVPPRRPRRGGRRRRATPSPGDGRRPARRGRDRWVDQRGTISFATATLQGRGVAGRPGRRGRLRRRPRRSSSTAACSSPPTPTPPADEQTAERAPARPPSGLGPDRPPPGSRDPHGRLAPATSASPAPATGSGGPCAAPPGRRSPSSATSVEISVGSELIRVHPIRHDRTKEHGALANPSGRPRRTNAA